MNGSEAHSSETIASNRLPPLDMSIVGHSPNRELASNATSSSRLGDTGRRPLPPVSVSDSLAAAALPSTSASASAEQVTGRNASLPEHKKQPPKTPASGGEREISELHQRILQVVSRDHSAAAPATREPSGTVLARVPMHTPEPIDGGIFGMRRARSLFAPPDAKAPLTRSKSLHDCDSAGSIQAPLSR